MLFVECLKLAIKFSQQVASGFEKAVQPKKIDIFMVDNTQTG